MKKYEVDGFLQTTSGRVNYLIKWYWACLSLLHILNRGAILLQDMIVSLSLWGQKVESVMDVPRGEEVWICESWKINPIKITSLLYNPISDSIVIPN